jgi:pyruvate/2-oxoglutarate dehydrogenase complex dihydrolipoamide dehydrogenase (E3) component
MAEAQKRFDFDLAIIGGGSAGYAAARTAAAEGLKTVVIEGGVEVGGLCILRGCMPTKALLYAAEVLHLATHARAWGVHAPDVSFKFGEVMRRKNALIKEFADFRQQQLASGNFEFLRAHARFVDPHRLELASVNPGKAKLRSLTARHFLIATGSSIAPFPLAQLAELDCLNSDTALKLKRLPRSLIVLGGGAVAVEYAQFFARFGVKVTMIQRSPHILHECDFDAAGELEAVFRREGIQLYTSTRLLGARRAAAQKEVTFAHNKQKVRVRAEEVFFGLGRRPNIAGLGLEAIGVRLESNRIVTDANMRSSVPHIFAAGDCTSPNEIVHLAVQQGEIAAHNAAHPKRLREMDYRLLAEVIFTEPQIATVGLTEKRAHLLDIPYQAASYRFADHGKSLIMEARDGFVKLLADPGTGEIIGGCCVGPHGGELIHEIIVAMGSRLTVHQLAALPHYHPTLAEIWTYPAEELAAKIPDGAKRHG